MLGFKQEKKYVAGSLHRLGQIEEGHLAGLRWGTNGEKLDTITDFEKTSGGLGLRSGLRGSSPGSRDAWAVRLYTLLGFYLDYFIFL